MIARVSTHGLKSLSRMKLDIWFFSPGFSFQEKAGSESLPPHLDPLVTLLGLALSLKPRRSTPVTARLHPWIEVAFANEVGYMFLFPGV